MMRSKQLSSLLFVAIATSCTDEINETQVVEVTCPEGYINGRGRVVPIDAPGELEERDLPCLAGDGTLRGYFVSHIESSHAGDDGYEPAMSEDDTFVFEPGDPRFDEVQAYYLISSMAGWIASSADLAEASPTALEVLRTDEVFLDYDNPEVMSRQWCGLLTLGMQRVSSESVNADVLLHEFGHHVVFSLNRELENSMLHEGLADYLTASMTNDSVIEPSESPAFDRSLENDHRAPDDVITRGAYCRNLLDIVEAEALESTYGPLVETLDDCLAGYLGDLDDPAHHWAGMIVSGALWELRTQLGETVLDPLILEVLQASTIHDTGELMHLLIEADAARGGSANEEAIRGAFVERGIDEDLDLGFRDMGFSTCE